MKALRHFVWDVLPLAAPGLLRTEIVARLADRGKSCTASSLDHAIVDLGDQDSIRRDTASNTSFVAARYWRGPETPAPSGYGGEHPWSEADLQKVRNDWAAGLSAAMIGREMSRSKNSVVGKVRRLGLLGRPSPIIRPGEKSRYPQAKKPALPAMRPERKVVSAPLLRAVARERYAVPETPLLMLPAPALVARSKVPPSLLPARKPNGADELYTAARSPRMCQWITVERPKVRMCSAVVSSVGSPWCLTHRAMCFTRAHGPRPADDAIPTNPHHSVRLGR